MLRPIYSRETAAVPIVQQDGWDPGPLWAGVEKGKSLICNGVRMNRRPAVFLKTHRSGTKSQELKKNAR